MIMVDVDQAELKKPTLHVDMPIWADAKDFLEKMDKAITDTLIYFGEGMAYSLSALEKKLSVVQPRQWEENGTTANVYAFVKYMSSRLPENSLTAVSNGACCVVGHQAYEIKRAVVLLTIVRLQVWDMDYQLR